MNNMDQLTMELLTNKKHYNKFLAANHPEQYEKQMELQHKKEKYGKQIMEMTDQLLFSPETQITNEIHEAFDIYMNACFRYLEMKEWEKDSDNEDVLFPPNGMRMDSVAGGHPSIMKSYWGKRIHKCDGIEE